MRRFALGCLVLLTIFAIAAPVGSATLSKSYQFKSDTTLEIGMSTDDGLRLDTIDFEIPSTVGGRFLRIGGLVRAHVAVSNVGEASQRVGIAVALFDDAGRLVGVASGGSGMVALKKERQKTYTLVFDFVNQQAYKATTFQVTLESKL